jgi:hypothetical protein
MEVCCGRSGRLVSERRGLKAIFGEGENWSTNSKGER